MSNLSKEKRDKAIEYLENIIQGIDDPEQIKIINNIESYILDKKFGLVWEEHSEDVINNFEDNIPIFIEESNRSLIKDNNKPLNFLIEGDNLHSLYLLNKTHKDKVDVIYIDPPYNTESKEFRYNDDYIDKLDGFTHSKWISFMKERLQVSYSLLKDTGCIMVSINENELFVLKLLLDEIFGEDNYLSTITVKVRHEDRILKGDKDFHEVTEYLLFYRKSKEFKIRKREKDNSKINEYIYEIEELVDNPQSVEMGGKIVDIFKPEEYLVRKVKANTNALKKINIRGSIKEGNSSGRFYMANLNELTDTHDGYLFKVYDMGADDLGHRYFRIPEESENRVNGDYFQGVPVNQDAITYIPYPNYVDFTDVFNNVGYEGGVDFRNGKKPVEFLKYCFELAKLDQNKNAVILDFFGGSASTFEAVQQLNQADGGNRKVIICTNNDVGFKNLERFRKDNGVKPKDINEYILQNNEEWKEFEEENGIATSVAYPRMKNVVNGYTITIRRKSIEISGIVSNFKYLKTDFIPKFNSDTSIRNELLDHIVPLIELEHHTQVDGINFAIEFDEDNLNQTINSVNEGATIFIPIEMMVSNEMDLLTNSKDITLIRIPEYYYKNELMEVGEIWLI